MKTAAKAFLILVSLAVLHEALRLVYTHAANAYEVSQPHCRCGDPPLRLVWGIRFADFFFEWPTGNYYFSDFLWGSVATALYFWIGKRRRARRLTREISRRDQVGVWPPAPEMPESLSRN